ncbi:MAG: hypothetical protein K6A34_06315 [Methanobrevibacter sp.]|nr:hypothetical protein [Methanobrevibacter sp.]
MYVSVQEDLNEWKTLIKELKTDEEKFQKLNKHYKKRESDLLINTDFNKIYGANNDKIRKAHVQKELKNTLQDKDNLELKIEDEKRRISFLKADIYAKVEFMKLGII